jgi:hypothetical protein
MAALFSFDNPDLLDAAVSFEEPNHPCLSNNATNKLDRIFRIGQYANLREVQTSNSNNNNITDTDGTPWSIQLERPVQIPSNKYYTDYQVAVVLGGIGAAFRTARHLSAGQAVVLQDFLYEEWFVKYMTPYVHYIPLKRDLSDLRETMEWIRDHPEQVKTIAEKGLEFYHVYLAFQPNEDHWYELIWHMSANFGHNNVTENNRNPFLQNDGKRLRYVHKVDTEGRSQYDYEAGAQQ